MRLLSLPRPSPLPGARARGLGARSAFGVAVAIALVLLSGGATPALANGVGDLYAATSAGVLELHVTTSSIVNTIPITPAPTALAFSPDGRRLYVVSDGAHVTPIEIETLEPADPIAMPGGVTALAFPSGQILVGTIPTHRTLVFIPAAGGSVTETAELPGAGNLLAGDRHEPRVVVAEAGKNWLEVVDPATSAFRKATLDGEVRAIAIERDRGGVLVATHNPDAVTRIDLTTLAVTWKATLPSVPSGVAAMASGDVASGGSKLWRVSAGSTTEWSTAKGEVLGLAVSDEGKALHVAERDQIEVLGADGTVLRTLALPGKGLTAMAPVPAGSSLFTGNANARQTSGPTVSGRPGAAKSLPPTSTITDDVERIVNEPRTQGALTVAAILLCLSWLAIRRHDRRQGSRRVR